MEWVISHCTHHPNLSRQVILEGILVPSILFVKLEMDLPLPSCSTGLPHQFPVCPRLLATDISLISPRHGGGWVLIPNNSSGQWVNTALLLPAHFTRLPHPNRVPSTRVPCTIARPPGRLNPSHSHSHSIPPAVWFSPTLFLVQVSETPLGKGQVYVLLNFASLCA